MLFCLKLGYLCNVLFDLKYAFPSALGVPSAICAPVTPPLPSLSSPLCSCPITPCPNVVAFSSTFFLEISELTRTIKLLNPRRGSKYPSILF